MLRKITLVTLLIISASVAVAQTTESFGSDDSTYSVKYDANSTFQLGNETDRVADVTTERQYTSFTGYVEVPDACTEIQRKFEETDSEIVMKLDTYSTGDNCADQETEMYAKYSFEMKSEESFRLEVRHNGREVRTIETSAYEPGNGGFLQEIIDIIMRFF